MQRWFFPRFYECDVRRAVHEVTDSGITRAAVDLSVILQNAEDTWALTRAVPNVTTLFLGHSFATDLSFMNKLYHVCVYEIASAIPRFPGTLESMEVVLQDTCDHLQFLRGICYLTNLRCLTFSCGTVPFREHIMKALPPSVEDVCFNGIEDFDFHPDVFRFVPKTIKHLRFNFMDYPEEPISCGMDSFQRLHAGLTISCALISRTRVVDINIPSLFYDTDKLPAGVHLIETPHHDEE